VAVAGTVIVGVTLALVWLWDEQRAQRERHQSRTEFLAARVTAFRRSTGRWPKTFSEMAPPACSGDACVLSEETAPTVENSHRIVVDGGQAVVCFRDQCSEADQPH